MLKKLIGLMVLLTMCLSLFLPPHISTADSIDLSAVSVSVSVQDSDRNNITGKIPVDTDFYVKATIDIDSSVDPALYAGMSLSVYCAVFNSDKMVAAYKAVNEAGVPYAEAKCRIPQEAGEDYYIKIFVWEDSSLTPLNKMIVFNASSPYETRYIESDGLYTGKELLKDASCENDNMINDGWDARNASRITRSSEQKLDGSYSCKVSERKNYYDSVRQNITDALISSGSGRYVFGYSVYPVFDEGETKKGFGYNLVMYDIQNTKSSPLGTKLYISNAQDQQWNSKEKTLDITVPDNLYKADLYVETSEGNSCDFYIDKWTIKKLITHEEYLRDNSPKDYTDSGMDEYLEIIEACSSSNYTSVYPKNSNAVIKNPYKGLNYYTYNDSFSTLDLTKDGAQNAKVVYHRLSWKALEPNPGEYNFDFIENNINILKEHNMMLGIGIGSCLTYNGYNNTTNAEGAPDWLFDEPYSVPYTLQEVGNGKCNDNKVYTVEETVDGKKVKKQYIRVPVYNDPTFKERMQSFLNAFAARFNNNPNIAFVDMRNYGNWGEWHFHSFNDTLKNHSYYDENGVLQTYTDEDLNNLVDMFKGCKLPLAMFTARTAQLTHAMKMPNVGIRVDGTMNPTLIDEHRKMAYADGKNFAVAEWFDQPEKYYSGGTYESYGDYMPVFMEKVIKEGKASYMAMGYWNPEDFYSRFSDLVHRVANKIGYWFKVSKITYPKNLTDGIFSMTVKNDGVTQLYAGYNRNACVKLALADSQDNIIDTVVLEDVDPEDWKAGKYSFVAKRYSFENTQGAQKLYMGIFSDKSNTNPDIKLGIDADVTEDGWYDVTSMTSNTYKSDNKLYTASYPYADYGYGYREPYYAFDNNGETYWASEIRKDEYLEIDFGEYVTVGEMMLNCVDSSEVKYSVEGYDGKNWVTLYSGQSVNSGANNIALAQAKVSKVRLVFNENLSTTLKVAEMYID